MNDVISDKIQWVEIENGRYAVSNSGLVKRLRHRHKSKVGTFLAPRFGGYKKRYIRYSIKIGRRIKDEYAHRLVLKCFVGPPPFPNWEASHLDGNPHNNHVSNLKWMSPLQNSRLKASHGTSGKGSGNAMAILTDDAIEKIVNAYIAGATAKDLAQKYHVCAGSIQRIVGRKGWLHIPISKEKEMLLANRRKQNIKDSRDRANQIKKDRASAIKRNKAKQKKF